MFIKIRRDTLIILALAFVLIFSGRLITYMAYASSSDSVDGVQISGVIIKGNDIIPLASIRANVADAGFRSGSYIRGDVLVTSKREIPLSEAIDNAETFAKKTTLPGTTVKPIAAADVKVDKTTGLVTVNVIEDFSTVELSKKPKV